MQITSTIAAVVLGIAVLAGCGAQADAVDPTRGRQADADRLTQQAEQYVGDPWEKRFRQQFWADQHVHDSWNPCHIGENVPDRLQGSGPACWERLRSQTGR